MRSNIDGIRFGRLVPIRHIPPRGGRKQRLWICECDCGGIKVTLQGYLMAGRVKSCGCLINRGNKTHGMRHSPSYTSWVDMRSRCYNTKRHNYKYYGGRGVIVCERWRDSFENFYEDMGARPEGHTLDRIDTNGNYEHGNCRWSDKLEQAKNRRTTAHIEDNGQTKTLREWSEVFGIKTGTLQARYAKGWRGDDLFQRTMTPSEAATAGARRV